MAEPPAQPVQRLTVMLRSGDHARHHSLAVELLSRAKKDHLAGATMLQAVEGQGRSGEVHHQRLFREDTPLALLIVDNREKIDLFLARNHELLDEALVIVDDVRAFRA